MMAGIPAYASTTTSETKQESQNTNEQPPEKPDGEAPSGADGQQGEKPDGEPPEKPDGEKPDGQPGGGQGGPGGSQVVDSYDAVTEYTEDTDTEGENYTSTGTDENAVLVSNGAVVTLKDSTIDRTSEDSTGGDNSSFYGVGAALLTIDGTPPIGQKKRQKKRSCTHMPIIRMVSSTIPMAYPPSLKFPARIMEKTSHGLVPFVFA